VVGVRPRLVVQALVVLLIIQHSIVLHPHKYKELCRLFHCPYIYLYHSFLLHKNMAKGYGRQLQVDVFPLDYPPDDISSQEKQIKLFKKTNSEMPLHQRQVILLLVF
jgi:hypothetical protein